MDENGNHVNGEKAFGYCGEDCPLSPEAEILGQLRKNYDDADCPCADECPIVDKFRQTLLPEEDKEIVLADLAKTCDNPPKNRYKCCSAFPRPEKITKESGFWLPSGAKNECGASVPDLSKAGKWT